MPYDEAHLKAARRGIVKVRTIHPDPNNPHIYAHVYVVRKKGKHGGHTIAGPVKEKG